MQKIKVLARVSTFSFASKYQIIAWFKLRSENGKLHRYSKKSAP